MLISQTNRLGQSIFISIWCVLIALAWYLLPHPVVAIGLSLLPMIVLLMLWQPFLMVLLFVLFSFFRVHEVFPPLYSLRIPLLLSLAGITTLGWHVLITRNIKVYWRPELTRASLFFIMLLPGILLAGNRPVAIDYFSDIYWKIIVMTFAIAWLLQADKDFRLTLRLITFTGLLVGLVALYNKMNGIDIVEGSRVTIGRSFGSVLGDPNDLSLVLLFPFSYALTLILSPNLTVLDRWVGSLTGVVLFLAIVATQSRGGLLGIVAVLAVFAWRRVHSKFVLIGSGAFLILLLYLVAGISGRASGGAAEAGLDESALGRLHAWEAAFSMAVDNPIFGVGLNNFYYNYFYYSNYWDGLNHAVHSTWFGVLAETGFIGLLLFLAMVFAVVRSAKNSLSKVLLNQQHYPPVIQAVSEGNLSGIVGFCVSGTFLTQGFTWPLYILLALTVGIAHFVDKSSPD